MSLYKRSGSPYWWIKLSHNGRRIQQSSGTSDKAKAREYHDKLKASLWDQERLGIRPVHSWKEAAVRWLRESTHKASQGLDKMHLQWLDKFLGGLNLTEISRDVIDRITQARLADKVSNASVNRMLQCIRVILRRAVNEWEWLDRAPKIRFLPEPIRRVRWLTREEAEKLIAALPEHLAPMVRFSLETGLRKSNVTDLKWSQVDLEGRKAWIHPDQAKARKAIAVPLSAEAVAVLKEQLPKKRKEEFREFVFVYHGKPVTQVNGKAWKGALKRAGIEDFRWHDLRHTWASWHVQAGTPLYVLQELGAWESVEMVRRYAHLSADHLASYVDRAAGLRPVPAGAVATLGLQ
jgi:integrase